MRRVDVAEATATLADAANDLNGDAVIVMREGKPIAALVPIAEDQDWESVMMSTSPDFLALLEQSRARLRAEGGLSTEEVRRELGLASD